MAIFLSGNVKGAFGAGAAIALQRLGLGKNPSHDAFDSIIGTSTGAPVAAYLLAGQIKDAASVYHEECVTGPFFNPMRWIEPDGKPVADVDMLKRIFRKGRKMLHPQRIHQSRTELLLAGTRADTGALELIDAKKSPNIVDLMGLSIAIPGAYAKSVEYEGFPYTDGAVAEPLPIQAALKLFPNTTDVLVISNLPEGESSYPKAFIKMLVRRARNSVTDATMRALERHDESYADALQRVRGDTARRYLIMRPDDVLVSRSKTTADLKNISKSAERALLDQCALARST